MKSCFNHIHDALLQFLLVLTKSLQITRFYGRKSEFRNVLAIMFRCVCVLPSPRSYNRHTAESHQTRFISLGLPLPDRWGLFSVYHSHCCLLLYGAFPSFLILVLPSLFTCVLIVAFVFLDCPIILPFGLRLPLFGLLLMFTDYLFCQSPLDIVKALSHRTRHALRRPLGSAQPFRYKAICAMLARAK